MTTAPGTRIDLDGRVFFIGRTRTGVLKVVERRVYEPGRPWECLSDVIIYHAGGGRKPGPMARRVLALAPELQKA